MVVNMDFGAKAPLYVYNLYHSWFFLLYQRRDAFSCHLSPLLLLTRFLILPDYVPVGYLFQPDNGDRRCTENVVQPTLSSTIPFSEACQFSSYAIYILYLPLRIQRDATTINDWKLTILSFRILMYAIHLALQLLG
jgi:hypothetical protein